MELSKRALGFFCRQYGIILRQNHLANTLGSCALSAVLCATVCASAVFVTPQNAMAGTPTPTVSSVYTITDDVTKWTSEKNISGDFLITGNSANAKHAGIYAGGTGSNSIIMALQSGHTITMTTTTEGDIINADTYGMRAERDQNTLINAGSIIISVTANGKVKDTNNGPDDADTYGMYASGSNNILTNSGTIFVTATSTYEGPDSESFAYGMSIEGLTPTSVLTNNGVINVKATSAYDTAWTRGMYTLSSGTITNNGTLNLHSVNIGTKNTSTDSNTKGAMAQGMCALDENTLINNGTITATAQTINDDAKAYGMVIFSDGAGTCTLNNYGTINVAATSTNGNASAYQAYIEGHQSYATTGNIGTWTMKLGEAYGKQANGSTYYVFGVGQNATLNFGVDGKGANFIISGAGADFKVGKEYKISDMVNVETGGTVSGFIASVTSSSELLKVELVKTQSDTVLTSNPMPKPVPLYANQAIKGTLNITAGNSPAQGATGHTLRGAMRHMDGISNVLDTHRGNSGKSADMNAKSDTSTMYADASTTFTDAGGSYISPESPVWKAFLMPFYSTTSENGGAYDTNMNGLVVGASRSVNDNFVFGFHTSLAKAKSDGSHTDSDAISYALGINGVYNVNDSLYFRGQLTGFFSENDINMVSGTGIFAQKASADMDTYGMYAELAAGYDIALAPQHVLTPELALSYMYAHMEGFESEFTSGFGGVPFSMASENYNALYADASLRWTGAYELGTNEKGSNLGTLKPTVKAGIRQALTNPEMSSTINIFGASATTHADANETAFTCEAGLAWAMDDVTLSATYMGEFGNVEYSHMGMFKVEWKF